MDERDVGVFPGGNAGDDAATGDLRIYDGLEATLPEVDHHDIIRVVDVLDGAAMGWHLRSPSENQERKEGDVGRDQHGKEGGEDYELEVGHVICSPI